MTSLFILSIITGCGSNESRKADPKTNIEPKKEEQIKKANPELKKVGHEKTREEEKAKAEKAENAKIIKEQEKAADRQLKIDALVNQFTVSINRWDNDLDAFNKALAKANQDWPALENQDLSGMDDDEATKFLPRILDIYTPLQQAYSTFFNARSDMDVIILKLRGLLSDKAHVMDNLKKSKSVDIMGGDVENNYKALDKRINTKMAAVIALIKQ